MAKKSILGALMALVGVFALASTAGAQYNGPETVTVVQGEQVNVTGSGCQPGETVTFEITSGAYSADVGSTTADDDGSYTATVTVPLATPVGAATLSGTCGDVVSVLNLDVRAATTTAPPVNSGTLPRTGSDNVQTMLGVGAGFLLLGGALAVGASRTRRATVTA